MGSKIGQNNFLNHQKQMISSGKKSVSHALDSLKVGFRPENITQVAVAVSKITGISSTTLLRNKEYRKLIHSFFAKKNFSLSSIPSSSATPEQLLQKTKIYQIENNNLKQEVARLKKILVTSEEQKDKLPDQASKERSFQYEFEATCRAMHKLLKYVSEHGFVLENKIIIDRGEIDGSITVIAEGKDLSPFLSWIDNARPKN